MKTFTELSKIDVGEFIEKKGRFNYLSWADAASTLLKEDPTATWSYGDPQHWGKTVIVFCTVTAFGKSMTAQLPVMNNNKAISDPGAFDVNTAMQRCLAKAIALHGIGLYIYRGEDFPTDEEPQQQQQHPTPHPLTAWSKSFAQCLKDCKSAEDVGNLLMEEESNLIACPALWVNTFKDRAVAAFPSFKWPADLTGK